MNKRRARANRRNRNYRRAYLRSVFAAWFLKRVCPTAEEFKARLRDIAMYGTCVCRIGMTADGPVVERIPPTSGWWVPPTKQPQPQHP